MAKLADALDLGSSAARHVGSTPIIRTKKKSSPPGGFLIFTKKLNKQWLLRTQKTQAHSHNLLP